MRKLGRIVPQLLVFVLGCGFLGGVFGQKVESVAPPDEEAARNSLWTFTQVYQLIEQNYADPIDANKAIFDGAIPGMLRVLDPHSNFFDPKAYAQLQEDQSGRYFGIGMSIGARSNKVVVISPFSGSPAYKSGIRPGDVIAAIDGKPTDNMTTEQVAELVRGPRGSKVVVTILREGSDKPLEFTITRDEIPRLSVDSHFMVRPGVGYLHIASFDETTDRELSKVLNEFGDLQGLVLDLRQDPGGLLNQAVDVAGEFLPKGSVVVSQKGRASPEKIYRASTGNGGKNYPIVVLVNRGTASAAEIVSGAIQDHDRGLVAGQVTFGKGLVQTVYPLSSETGLALTTAKYYTPSGRLIQRKYEGVSLYDYYYKQGQPVKQTDREVKHTDTGRVVYGGDGITPDVIIPEQKLNKFQNGLLLRYAFFDFAQSYVKKHQITPTTEVNDQVLQDFRAFLTDKKIPYVEADFLMNVPWVKQHIKSELYTDALGAEEGQRALLSGDPEVLEALDLLPRAKQLEANAERVKAEKSKQASLREKN